MVSRRWQSFGKIQEYAATAEMLKRGLDVYMTLVDDKGIDCIVRKDANTYYDVQIKARSKNVKHPGYFNLSDISDARPNYFFVFYAEKPDKFWVIPSERITGSDGGSPLGKQIQPGRKSEGTWYVDPWWQSKTEPEGKTEPGFEEYEDAWHYLGAEKDL